LWIDIGYGDQVGFRTTAVASGMGIIPSAQSAYTACTYDTDA
jgi:hypothetical protein